MFFFGASAASAWNLAEQSTILAAMSGHSLVPPLQSGQSFPKSRCRASDASEITKEPKPVVDGEAGSCSKFAPSLLHLIAFFEKVSYSRIA